MANGRTRKWENSEEGKAWQKEYQDKSPETRIRLRKDSGIPVALEKPLRMLASPQLNTSVLQSQSVWKKRGMRRDIRHLPLTTPE